jgi:hypothetical protein
MLKCPKCGQSFAVPEEAPVAVPAAQEVATPTSPEESAKTYAFKEDLPKAPPTRESAHTKGQKKAKPLDEDEDDLELEDEEEIRPRRKPTRPAPEVLSDEDEDEDDEDDSDEEELGRPRRRSPGKSKQEKGSKLLFVSLVVGGILVLLLAGGGAGAYWCLNRDRNSSKIDDPLVYVPADSPLVMGFAVGTLMNQPAAAAMVEKAATSDIEGSFLTQVKKDTGIEFKDLFSEVVIVAPGSTGTPGQFASNGKHTLIAKSRVAFDQHKIRNSCKDAIPVRHEGKTYFKVNEGPNFKLLYMPSNWIMVMTNMTEPELQTLITAESKAPTDSTAHMEQARDLQKNHFWLVAGVSGPLAAAFQQDPSQAAAMGQPDLKALADAAKQARAVGLWGNLDGDALSITLGVRCSDNPSAKKMTSALKGAWDDQMKPTSPLSMATAFAPKSLREVLRDVKSSIRFSTQEQVAQASAKVSVSKIQGAMPDVQAMIPQGATAPGRGQQPAIQAPGGRGGRGGPRSKAG